MSVRALAEEIVALREGFDGPGSAAPVVSQAYLDLLGSVKEGIDRLEIVAALHEGDEHPSLEEAMLQVAKFFRAALTAAEEKDSE